MFSLCPPTSPSYPLPTSLQTSFYQNQTRHYYSPQTPSPLRTARNANLMPPPPPATPSLKSSPSSPPSSENAFSAYDFSSPLQSRETGDENSDTTPRSEDLNSATFSTPNVFSKPKNASAAQKSRFAARARSSSPQAMLGNATSSARDRRKSLFLDRIRQRREDDRFADKGDQMLRMDWVRERREWEERLARRAWEMVVDLEAGEGDNDNDNEILNGCEGEELSPIEEREIEELLSYLPVMEHTAGGDGYTVKQEAPSQQFPWMGDPTQEAGYGGDIDIVDDEDYDRLFMEMDVGGFETSTQPDPEAHHVQTQDTSRNEQGEARMDIAMDMS